MKHHISYFYNALLELHAASNMVWNIKFIKYRENKLIVTKCVQNVRHWHEHKHASAFALVQLRHHLATAPSRATHAVRRNFVKMFDAGKTEWLGYRIVKKLWRYVKPFSYNTSVSRTDRQTDGQTDRIAISISRVSVLTRDKKYGMWCFIFTR